MNKFIQKSCFYFLLIGLMSFNAMAQLGISSNSTIAFGTREGRSFVRNTNPVENVIDYQPFLYAAPRGTIIIKMDGDTVRGNYLYNLETETLVSADAKDTVSWNVIRYFTMMESENMERTTFSNMKLLWPENEYGGFFQDVKSSPFVKVKHYLEFIPKSWNPSTQTGDRNDRIEAFSEFYLKAGSVWIDIPKTKTEFFQMFGEYSKDLEKYAKKNKLKINNPEHIGTMVDWIVRKRR